MVNTNHILKLLRYDQAVRFDRKTAKITEFANFALKSTCAWAMTYHATKLRRPFFNQKLWNHELAFCQCCACRRFICFISPDHEKDWHVLHWNWSIKTHQSLKTALQWLDSTTHSRLYGPVTETFLLTLSSIFTCFWNAGTTMAVNVSDFWRNIFYGCSCRSLGWTDQCTTPTNCQNLHASYIIIIHMLQQETCIHSHKYARARSFA